MGKKVKVLRKVYISPDDLQELDKAAGIGEKGEGKLEYVCLRAVWRETSEEKPGDGTRVIFMVAEHGEESKLQISDICMGIYNAPSEPDEYGDDGEGFYSNDKYCFSCGEVFGWAYAGDLVPGFKEREG